MSKLKMAFLATFQVTELTTSMRRKTSADLALHTVEVHQNQADLTKPKRDRWQKKKIKSFLNFMDLAPNNHQKTEKEELPQQHHRNKMHSHSSVSVRSGIKRDLQQAQVRV